MRPRSNTKKSPSRGIMSASSQYSSSLEPLGLTSRAKPMKNAKETELAIISATFANAELRTSKAMLSYYANATTKLSEANKKLEDELSTKENQVITEYLEEKLKKATKENAELRAISELAFPEAQEQSEREKAELCTQLAHKDTVIEELRGRVAALEDELRSVTKFRDERDAHHAAFAALQADHARGQLCHAREEQSLRLALMEERVGARADAQALTARRSEDIRRLALELRDRDAQLASEENAELHREREELLLEGIAARDAAEALRHRNDALRRRADLAARAEAESAASGARQRREIAALRAQVRAAEDGLTAATEQYERRLREQQKAHAAETKRLTQERDEAHAVGRVLRRDLVKLRGLARAMLERQTDLELFFHDALAHVRRKALEERRGGGGGGRGTRSIGFGSDAVASAEYTRLLPRVDREPLLIGDHGAGGSAGRRASAASSTLSLPLVQSGHRDWQLREGPALLDGPFDRTGLASIPSVPTLEDLRTVEVSQLSWRDKERVLQLLFKKLQGRSKPKSCPGTNEMDKLLDDIVAVNAGAHTFITESAQS